MPSPTSRIDALAKILADGFSSRIDGGAVVPPSLFDVHYNTSVIACAMFILGRATSETNSFEVNASILRFACFLATRPILLEDFELWHAKTRNITGLDLESWPHLPRGFLTDRTHSGAVDFLSATGQLFRSGSNVAASSNGTLRELSTTIQNGMLFVTERSVLARLKELRVTQTMLGVAR